MAGKPPVASQQHTHPPSPRVTAKAPSISAPEHITHFFHKQNKKINQPKQSNPASIHATGPTFLAAVCSQAQCRRAVSTRQEPPKSRPSAFRGKPEAQKPNTAIFKNPRETALLSSHSQPMAHQRLVQALAGLEQLQRCCCTCNTNPPAPSLLLSPVSYHFQARLLSLVFFLFSKCH